MLQQLLFKRATKFLPIGALFFSLLTYGPISYAALEFNFSKSTPIGSWAIREDISTNHKGKQTVNVIKTSAVGKEDFDGSPHVWVEMETQAYKIKKDKRKKKGDKVIMKMLLDTALFSESPANIITNITGHAKTIIIQNGNEDPMLIEQGGALAQVMMQAAGIQIEFDYTEKGNKSVKVPAGDFNCKLVQGNGTAESKILFKKMKVQSEIESCYTNQVPFGLVQANAKIKTNGKDSTNLTQLIKFGKSGATSAITKEPVAAPQIPKLF